jgi:hypothetical protein
VYSPGGGVLLPRLPSSGVIEGQIMKILTVATAVAISLTPGLAAAATKDGSFSVRGIGSQQCKSVVQAVSDKKSGPITASVLGSWIAGYLSHSNRMAAGVFELMPISDTMVVAQMVVNVCKGNPDIMVEPAVAIAIKSLNGAAQNADSSIVDIKNDKYETQVRKAVVVRVQEELAKQKLLPAGSADGNYGPNTRDALVAFQKSKKMTETGIPDPATIIDLFFSEKGK